MDHQESFFDFAAEVGLTKHIGGVKATEELAKKCHIGQGSYVLDVGCGAGITPSILAKRYGCRVVGVDIREAMVKRSRQWAKRAGLSDMLEFRAADAQDLPFEDNLFDAVITESVTVFPEDKQKAVSEYARVTKPGGYIGLNESTWILYPPPRELLEWAAQDLGENVHPLMESGWKGLLETAGLKEILTKVYRVDLNEESKGMLQRYGCTGTISVMGRMLRLYFGNPAYRKFVKEVKQGGVIPAHLVDYFGYGIYVGRK